MKNEELALCAQINFENFEKAFPVVKEHPYYIIAKAQLDEALGGQSVEKTLLPYVEKGKVKK